MTKLEQKKSNQKQKARELARSLNSTMQRLAKDGNKVYTLAGNVSPYVMKHWVDMESGEQGIAALILKILREAGAEFPLNVGETTNRTLALKAGLTTDEIISQVVERFSQGSTRYSRGSIKTYLSQWLSKPRIVKGQTVQPIVASLEQSTFEDSNRGNSTKPRHLWFIIQRQ